MRAQDDWRSPDRPQSGWQDAVALSYRRAKPALHCALAGGSTRGVYMVAQGTYIEADADRCR